MDVPVISCPCSSPVLFLPRLFVTFCVSTVSNLVHFPGPLWYKKTCEILQSWRTLNYFVKLGGPQINTTNRKSEHFRYKVSEISGPSANAAICGLANWGLNLFFKIYSFFCGHFRKSANIGSKCSNLQPNFRWFCHERAEKRLNFNKRCFFLSFLQGKIYWFAISRLEPLRNLRINQIQSVELQFADWAALDIFWIFDSWAQTFTICNFRLK